MHVMAGTRRHNRAEFDSARAVFAARLAGLSDAAGNPTLQRVASAANARMRAARGGDRGGVTAQRISDWRAGRNVPKRFESIEPVLLTLFDLAAATPGPVAAELVDLHTWRRLWADAVAEKDVPSRTSRPTLEHGRVPARPAVTTVLRRDIADFVGRDGELRRILDTAQAGRVVSIHTIDGMPGVGKTALATRAAHLLADRFPDGRYTVALDAHTPGRTPADPADVLATLLTDSGVDPRFLPETMEGRRNLWLDRSSGRRMLLVLDDARDHAQVEPLLPAGEECLTLITSRRRLVALDGAVPLPLDVLDPDDAAGLFTTLARRTPADAEQPAVAEIVRLCGCLPLAIVLLAGRLAHHPAWTIPGLAVEFAAAEDRLGELDTGQRAVRVAFTMSYRDLPPERQRLFRCLGMHPGPDADAHAVAAFADIPVAAARAGLESLYTDHLVEEVQPGRYRMHDLLRLYARALADIDPIDPEGNDSGMDRLLDYYRTTAAAADRYLARRTRAAGEASPAVTRSVCGAVDFADEMQALRWMRAERANVLACIDHCFSRQPRLAIELVQTAAGLLERDGPWPQATHLHERAFEAARRLADRPAEADALINLGKIRELSGDLAAAADLHQQAAARFRGIGDLLGEANALNSLGLVRRSTGDNTGAADLHGQAISLFRQVGDRLGEANAASNLGHVYWSTSDYAQTAEMHRRAFELYRAIGARLGEASAANNLGLVLRQTDDYTGAAKLHRQALTLFRQIGYRLGEVNALSNLGLVQRMVGDYADAADLHSRALAIAREIGYRIGEANNLGNLGLVRRLTGDYADAADLHSQALTLFRVIGYRLGEASCLGNLGAVREQMGDLDEAADLHFRALAIYRELDNRHGEAGTLTNLSLIRHRTGHIDAPDLQRRALRLYREIGDSLGEITVLIQIGTLLLETGEPQRALAAFLDALASARRVPSPLEQARALDGAARCRVVLGDSETAVSELREAVDIFRRLAAHEAEASAEFLDTLCDRPR